MISRLIATRQFQLHIVWPQKRVGASITLVVCTLTLVASVLMPLWLPRMVRYVIPDRYVEAYAPEFVQEIIFQRSNSSELLPSSNTELSGSESARSLLSSPAAVSTTAPSSDSPSSVNTVAVSGGQSEAVTSGLVSIPASYQLDGFRHDYQGWNNCGPTTLSMALSYWGAPDSQKQVANFVKPNPEDRNVRPDELVDYAVANGFGALVRVNGNMDLLKKLISSGYPPMIEQGFDVEKLGWMGHYVLLTGYSDETQTFTAQDSYLGPSHKYSYAEIETYWWHFNNTYLVVFQPAQEREVDAIVGQSIDNQVMWARSADNARARLTLSPNDAFGWFNLGSSLVAQGSFNDAAVAFDQARALGLPWRMLWYQFGPYEAYLAMGRFDDVRLLADTTLADNIYSEEAYFYKGRAYQAEGRIGEAQAQFETALQYNSHYEAARQALDSIHQ